MPQSRSTPLISIVVPSYNYGRYLERTLISILDQNYPRTQIIVIDGASNDGTAAVLKSYASHLDVCISEPDRGQTDAINKGFRHVKGDIFNWLNADDALEAHSFERIAEAWLHGADLIIGQCRMVYEREGKSEVPRIYAPCYHSYFDFQSTAGKGFLYQPSVFLSTALAAPCFPLDISLRQVMDYQFHLRALRQGPKVRLIQEPLATFYYHGANMSSSDVPKIPELERVLKQELHAHPPRQQKSLKRTLSAALILADWSSRVSPPSPAAILGAIAANPALAFRKAVWMLLARALDPRRRSQQQRP
jgi:hypothetical protein